MPTHECAVAIIAKMFHNIDKSPHFSQGVWPKPIYNSIGAHLADALFSFPVFTGVTQQVNSLEKGNNNVW